MNKLVIADCKRFIHEASKLMNDNKTLLTELDSKMGDGDLGITMTFGFLKASEFANSFRSEDIGRFFFMTSMTISKAVPSTMGSLIAAAFMRVGKELSGKTELGPDEFLTLTKGLVDGIMEKGKAKPGDCTIIDALYPAYETTNKNVLENASLNTIIIQAYEAACKGLEATKAMTPTVGKAFYNQDASIGMPDQGAVAGMLLYKAWTIINN